jgi:serine phosphatase RsbU (regulator of sigma subunit)
MRRPVSIRRSLLRNLVLVILLLSGGILLTTILGARRAVRELSRSLTAQKLDESEQRLRRFFDPVARELQIARSWGEAGLLDPDELEQLGRLLVPVMERTRQVSSIIVADDRGRELMILRTDDAWTSRQTRRDEWGDRTVWHAWTSLDDVGPPDERELDYDPRDRPWFQGAMRRRAAAAESGVEVPPDERTSWTEPYPFFTSGDPGITVSIAFDPGTGIAHVVAFDVLLNDISAFTTAMRVSENGGVVVLAEDGTVIGLPRDERYLDADSRRDHYFKRPEELGWTLASDAANAFAVLASGEAARFRSGGAAWWGEGRSLRLSTDRSMWIGVVVPERDLLGEIPTLRLLIIAITAAVLLVAIARAVVLARRYSEPIELLVTQSDRMSRGDLEPVEPIRSNIAEVVRLAAAHERAREGLRSLLKLERDLQVARQIQQSTLPTRVPVVPGFEIAAWNEPAEETGGDAYDLIGLAEGPAGPDGPAERCIDPPAESSHAVLLLADATGHGIGPALSATQIRAMLRMAVRTRTNLPALVRALNEQLHADLPPGRFITAFLGVVEGSTGDLRTFSAGQGPLLLYRAADDAFTELPTDTVPFGIVPDLEVAVVAPITMGPGDVLAVFSDGIYEAMDPDGRQFGADRVRAVITDHREQTAEAILAAVRREVEAFARGRAADDDRTGILVRRATSG